jgi:hypothetical protein
MSESVRNANKTRAQKAKATHEAATKQRKADAESLKALYLAKKDDAVLQDVLEKAKRFISLHNKIAQDGVGARPTGEKYENGMDVVENIYLTNNQRAGHLDKSAGIQELVDYIERQITPPAPDSKPKSKQKAV